MGIFPRIDLSKKQVRRYSAWDNFWYNTVSKNTAAGVGVNETNALKYLTVWDCVSLIAGDVGRMPLQLYKKNNDGSKESITNHRVYSLIHNNPNETLTSFNWRETCTAHLLLWGNLYNYIIRNGKGQIIELRPIEPGTVRPELKNGRLLYHIKKEDGTEETRGRDDIFHVPGFSLDGVRGVSIISLAREAIGLGMAAETFGSNFFSKGTHPAGILSLPDWLEGEKKKEFKQNLREQHQGLGKSHSIMVLEGGSEYKTMTMPLNDAQFLETREFQRLEIAACFHVPPYKIGIRNSNSSYNSLEQENQNYIDSCLAHWFTRWEQNINLQLLSSQDRNKGIYAEFNLSGLLRGDSKDRAEYYKMLTGIGVPPNRIMEKENMNPIPGGDVGFVQVNMMPLPEAAKIKASSLNKPKPAAAPKEPEGEEEASRGLFPSVEVRAGVMARDNLIESYRPIFRQLGSRIVGYEVKKIKEYLDGQRAIQREVSQAWMDTFYDDFELMVKREISPTFNSFINGILRLSAEEIDADPIELKEWSKDYVNTYAMRHRSSSYGQIMGIRDSADIKQRLDEWIMKRPDKFAINETSRIANAVYQEVAFANDLGTTWRIRGRTCPYCKTLDGKRIRKGQHFLDDGDELEPDAASKKDDDKPMLIRGTKMHPPIHYKCDCYLSTI